MTLPAPRHRYTFAEYLELEEVARVRHEFYDGEIYGMAGGTPEHAAVIAALGVQLAPQLRKGCRLYSSDLRVRVLATGLATYPDVTVVCGPSERDPESRTHVVNPKVVVEVLSPSTAEYDRRGKLLHYQQIPSLEAAVLVDYEVGRVELWARKDDGWQHSEYGAGAVLPLLSIGAELSVDSICGAARDA